MKFKDGFAITDRYCVIHSKNIEIEGEVREKPVWSTSNIEDDPHSEEDKICHIAGNMNLKVDSVEDDISGVRVVINKSGMKLNDIFIESVKKENSLFFSDSVESDIVFEENVTSYIIKRMLVLFKKKHFDIFFKNKILLFKSNDLEMYFSYMIKSESVEKNKEEIEVEIEKDKKEPINISELLEKIAKDRKVKI